jgi:hypothetical protein
MEMKYYHKLIILESSMDLLDLDIAIAFIIISIDKLFKFLLLLLWI